MTAPALRVLHLVPDLAAGGGQQLLLWLRAHGAGTVEHGIWSLRDGPLRERLADKPGPVLVAHGTAPTQRLRELLDAVGAFDPHVLHTHSASDRPFGQIASARTGVPHVHTFHGLTPMPVGIAEVMSRPLDVARRLANTPRLVARYHLGIDAHVAVSRAARDQNAAEARLDPGRIRVVSPGLPPEAFAPAPAERRVARSSLGLDETAPVLLTVGSLQEAKGQREIAAVARALIERWPNLQWLVVGEGSDRGEIERRIEELDLQEHVRLLGLRHDVRALLDVADLVVATSHSESFGLSVLEAIAAGRPTVGYHVAGYDDFLPAALADGFVPIGDLGAVVEAVCAALTRPPEQGARRADAGRAAVQQFTVGSMEQGLIDVYRSLGRDRSRWARK